MGGYCHVVSCFCPFLSPCLPLLVVLGYRFCPSFPQLFLVFSDYLISPLFPPVPFFPLIRSLYLSLFLLLSLSDSCLFVCVSHAEPDYHRVCCNLVLSCRNLPVHLSPCFVIKEVLFTLIRFWVLIHAP